MTNHTKERVYSALPKSFGLFVGIRHDPPRTREFWGVLSDNANSERKCDLYTHADMHAYADPLLDEIEWLKGLLTDAVNTGLGIGVENTELRATIERQQGVMQQIFDSGLISANWEFGEELLATLQAELPKEPDTYVSDVDSHPALKL